MTPLRLPAVVAVLLALAPAAAPAAEKPYRPLAATIGRRVDAPAGLAEAARQLRAAAATKDADAVFALVADTVTFASTGITLAVDWRIDKRGPYGDGRAFLLDVGRAVSEGGPVGRDGKPIDTSAADVAAGLATIAEELDRAQWSRHPAIVGGYCTTPGAKWDVAAAKKAGMADAGALFVLATTDVRAEAAASAKVVAKATPGVLYAAGGSTDGYAGIRLPSGAEGWIADKSAFYAQGRSICFLPGGQGAWFLSAVVSATN